MLLLINNFNEKHHRKSRPTKLTLKACARNICNLHSCYNFALVLHENALVLSQSEARKFFFTAFYDPLISSLMNVMFRKSRTR